MFETIVCIIIFSGVALFRYQRYSRFYIHLNLSLLVYFIMYFPYWIALLIYPPESYSLDQRIREVGAIIWSGFIYFILCLTIFSIGFYWKQKDYKIPKIFAYTVNQRKRFLHSRMWIFLLYACIIYYVVQIGLCGNFGVFLYRARMNMLPMGMLVKSTLITVGYLSIYKYFCVLLANKRFEYRGLIVPLLVALLFLIQGDRNSLIYLGFLIVLGYHVYYKNIKLRTWIIMSFLAMGFTTALGVIRILLVLDEQIITEDISMLDGSSIENDGINNYLLVFSDFDKQEKLNGYSYLIGAVGVVPRTVWVTKPENITVGRWFTNKYYPHAQGGKPITVFGELFINFGWLGCLLIPFISGIVVRFFHRAYIESAQDPLYLVLYFIYFFELSAWGILDTGTFRKALFVLLPFLLLASFKVKILNRNV